MGMNSVFNEGKLLSEAITRRRKRMRVVNRFLVMLLLCLVVGGVAVVGAETQKPKMLVFINDNPPFEKQNAAMGEWIAEQVGVGFVPESYPDLSGYQTTLRQSLLSSKTAPDFFKWWSNYRLKPLVDAGLLADVSDLWQKHFADGTWPKSAAAEVTFNGKQYAIPYHYSHWGIIYNRHVFEELNLSVPTTWAQFIGVCKKIKASGRTPIAMTLEGRWQALIWWTEILIKTDPDLYLGLVNGTIQFADPRILKALQPWLEVIGYFPADSTLPWQEVYPKIYSGDFPMDLLGDWLFTSMQAIGADMEKDIGWFPVPPIAAKGNGFVLEISPLAIPANSPNIADTKKVFDVWMSREGANKWVELFSESSPAYGGLIPDKGVYKSIQKAGLFTNKVRYMPRWWEAVPVELVEYSIDKFGEVILDTSKLKNAMTDIDNFRKTMKK
jgi:multiple sugar transport system substrate-binding protein